MKPPTSPTINDPAQDSPRKQKNILIVFGGVGDMVCYLNISVEEALLRFKSNPLSEVYHPEYEIIEFDDEFNCYDVWEK
jgi:hypothetical protein